MRRGVATIRAQIEESIAPVWEANHVWLIFVLVTLWTAFPTAFAPIMSTLFVPLTLAAVGIILRGAAFVFRKESATLPLRRWFGATFALVFRAHAVHVRRGGRRHRVGSRSRRHRDG